MKMTLYFCFVKVNKLTSAHFILSVIIWPAKVMVWYKLRPYWNIQQMLYRNWVHFHWRISVLLWISSFEFTIVWDVSWEVCAHTYILFLKPFTREMVHLLHDGLKFFGFLTSSPKCVQSKLEKNIFHSYFMSQLYF